MEEAEEGKTPRAEPEVGRAGPGFPGKLSHQALREGCI